MLTLVYGVDWTANRDHIMNMLASDVSEKKSGRFLLVPELISHNTERRLCEIAGNTSSRYAEVLSFSRLTKRICEWSSCGIQECLDNGGRLVAMAAAARQLHSKLKAYASVETKPEFLAGMWMLLTSLSVAASVQRTFLLPLRIHKALLRKNWRNCHYFWRHMTHFADRENGIPVISLLGD